MGLIMLFLPRQDQHGDAGAPAELRHGVGEAEHAGADHGSDIVEAGVPPLGVPRRVDREPVVDRLLPRPCCDSLSVGCDRARSKLASCRELDFYRASFEFDLLVFHKYLY